MNQSRKDDQDVPNRQSNMEKAEGSRQSERGAGQERGGTAPSGGHQRSVMDDQDAFEHGSGGDAISRGMGSTGERGAGPDGERNRGGGISNRDMAREQDEQDRLPERGRSQSER
jgi:hypothetical protein